MFFSNKVKLSSLLEGAIDMHNHILPGLDDGASDLKTAINLVKAYKELGYTKIVATPHTMSDYYPNTSKTILNALELLNAELKQENITDITLNAASEYMIDPEFESIIDKNSPLLTFKDNYILVEMSYLRESENFNEVLYKLQLKNYQPILAHPERYSFYLDNFDKFYALKKAGIKLQLNMLSLTDHYGSKIKKVAKRLLKEDMYDFIGIDTHRIEHLEKVSTIKIPNKTAEKIKTLLNNNETLF